MKKEEVKEAFATAEKEAREKEVQQVKEVIKKTLEKLKEKQEAKRKLDKEIQILKRDIEDFKEGRLDKIAERQLVDQEAKEVSVFEIVKKEEKEVHHHHHYDRWYSPYEIRIKPYSDPYYWNTYGPSTTDYATTGNNTIFTSTCSTAKDASSGTYKLENGAVKYL